MSITFIYILFISTELIYNDVIMTLFTYIKHIYLTEDITINSNLHVLTAIMHEHGTIARVMMPRRMLLLQPIVRMTNS